MIGSIVDEQRQVEHAVLEEVLALRPDGLTLEELVRKMVIEPSWAEEDRIRQAVRELCGVGLLCRAGDRIAPTFAAIRFAELVVEA